MRVKQGTLFLLLLLPLSIIFATGCGVEETGTEGIDSAGLSGQRAIFEDSNSATINIPALEQQFRTDVIDRLNLGDCDDCSQEFATQIYGTHYAGLLSGFFELNEPFDVLLYNLDINLDSDGQRFDADVDVVFIVTESDQSSIVLDVGQEVDLGDRLYNPYTVTGVDQFFGGALDYDQSAVDGTLTISFGRTLRRFEIVTVNIQYEGEFNPGGATNPYRGVGMLQSTGYNGQPVIQTFGWPNYARLWLPSVDHPRDPASWIASVTIDNDFTTLSNGEQLFERVITTDEGDLTQRTFAMLQPVPTYALQVIASDFVQVPLGEVGGVPIDAYVYPGDDSFAPDIFAQIPEAHAYFDELFGDNPFSRYAMLEVPSSYGGMEHATIVSLADSYYYEGSIGARNVAIHELTHHWYGDNLHQSEWPAFWLNESLATFLTALAVGHLDGGDAYINYLTGRRNICFAVPFYFDDDPLHYTSEGVPGESTIGSFYAPYYKGPWIWHMLRVELGDDAFFEFLGDYTRENYFRLYDSDRVLAALNEATGEDFTQFFNEWVHQRGWPIVQLASTYDAEAGEATLTAQQVQDIAAYGTYTLDSNLALQVELDDGDPETPACSATIAFVGGSIEESATVACDSEPTVLTVLNANDLMVHIL